MKYQCINCGRIYNKEQLRPNDWCAFCGDCTKQVPEDNPIIEEKMLYLKKINQ